MKTPIVINTAGLSESAIKGFTDKQREFKSYKFGKNTEKGNKFYNFVPLSETETNITFEACIA
jgi:hypothetical protein